MIPKILLLLAFRALALDSGHYAWVWGVKVLPAKYDNLSSILKIYVVNGESGILKIVLWLPLEGCNLHTLTQTHIAAYTIVGKHTHNE